jgi:hypothetical protein
MNATEIQKMLDTALAHRKKAYKVGAPRIFIMSINEDIRRFQSELLKLGA